MAGLVQGFALGAEQSQRQSQEQTLSLQARQRLQLLPLPVQALGAELRQCAEQNPFLEYEPAVQNASLESLEEPELARNDQSADLDYYNSALEGFGDQADFTDRAEASRRHDWLILSQTEEETLYRHLEKQVLQTLEPGAQRDLTLLVCDALDADGYLRVPAETLLADWWQACGGDAARAEAGNLREAIRTVQGLDPVGVGARSLAECLELQVRADTTYDPKRSLRLRLCHRLGDVVALPRARLARILRCTPEELEEALGALKRLNPFPGRAFAGRENLESPEILALQEPDGRWRAVCDERLFPLFRVDEDAVAAARQSAKTREERACVSDLESRARLWVNAFHDRNDTLRRVAQAAFDRQGAFLTSGGDPATLKPLLQREVAEAIGYDESIVSRTIKDKSVRVATNRKPIPLKAFFTRAVAPAPGGTVEGVSEQQAKSALRALIASEDRARPLSDQALMEELSKQGIALARRTVAKYREQMGIPSTRERRAKGV